MVDLAMVLGTGFAPFRGGPLRLADEWGIGPVVRALDELSEKCGPRFRPCDLLREMDREHRRFYEVALVGRQGETAPALLSDKNSTPRQGRQGCQQLAGG